MNIYSFSLKGSGHVATEVFNEFWIYAVVFVIIFFVLLQCVIYMRKAWHRALGLGITNAQLKETLRTGIAISIMPTLPVLIVFLALTPLLGSPLPWLRLSVIGSAQYESYAANIALQSVGEDLIPGMVSIKGWITAVWVMTVGGSACVLWSSLAIKPVSMMYEKLEEKMDKRFINALGGGALAGTMAFVTVAFGLSAISTKGVVFGLSFLCGALLVAFQKKFPTIKWINEYLMTISMLAAMIGACLIF